jgi:hypothetical protein
MQTYVIHYELAEGNKEDLDVWVVLAESRAEASEMFFEQMQEYHKGARLLSLSIQPQEEPETGLSWEWKDNMFHFTCKAITWVLDPFQAMELLEFLDQRKDEISDACQALAEDELFE